MHIHLVQVTYTQGTYSGGGNVDNPEMSRKMPPLRWMVSEAKNAGLCMTEMRNEFLALEEVAINKSLTRHWRVLEILPLKRLTYRDASDVTRRWCLQLPPQASSLN